MWPRRFPFSYKRQARLCNDSVNSSLLRVMLLIVLRIGSYILDLEKKSAAIFWAFFLLCIFFWVFGDNVLIKLVYEKADYIGGTN